jgi:hypothetical protein
MLATPEQQRKSQALRQLCVSPVDKCLGKDRTADDVFLLYNRAVSTINEIRGSVRQAGVKDAPSGGSSRSFFGRTGMLKHPMAQRIEHWLLEKLIPWARNPRTHSDAQVAQIAASIAEFGFNNPILVDTKAGIIAGHGRLLAARKLHLKEVPVIVLDHLTDAQKRAYIIADNQLALNAGWDEELLRLELAALQQGDFDLSLIGFEDEELRRLLAAQDAVEGLTDEDAVPELPKAPVSGAGDLWILGDHKLVVGDATVHADVGRLMAGEAADLVFSDLPYNCAYEGYTQDKLNIQNDDMSPEQFARFLRDSFVSFRTVVKPGASLYICHSSAFQREFQNALEGAGFEVRCQIVWAKNTFAWGSGR